MELDIFALCGPFPKPPFDAFQINPLMTAPKKHSDMRRVILDLSHPDGASINSGIPGDSYLGVPYKLSLPSAQDLRDLIIVQGQGCHLWSIDLQWGYWQLRVSPMDWPLLGIAWDGAYYFDTAVPFGIRWGAMYMQRTTSVVTTLAQQHHIPCVAYIDDVASAQPPSQALNGKRRFQALLVELGLEENVSKGSEPSTHMTWLSMDFDSEAIAMAVPVDKMGECLRMSWLWVNKEHCKNRNYGDTSGNYSIYAGAVPHSVYLSHTPFILCWVQFCRMPSCKWHRFHTNRKIQNGRRRTS